MAIVSQDTPNSPVPSVLPDIPEAALADPPPPYPTPGRRQRQPRSHRARVHAAQLVTQHSQQSSTESQSDYEAPLSPYAPSVVFTDDEDAISMSRGGGIAGRTAGPTSENTLFLSLPNSRRQGRPRSFSMSSTTSAAESLAHTVMSLFQTEDDVCYGDGNIRLEPDEDTSILSSRRPSGLFSGDTWRRYFRPMGRKAFYRPLVHLAFINFPYALAAWVYLFIFTVVSLSEPLTSTFSFWFTQFYSREQLCLLHYLLAPFYASSIFSALVLLHEVNCLSKAAFMHL